jgi:hypothetical protein
MAVSYRLIHLQPALPGIGDRSVLEYLKASVVLDSGFIYSSYTFTYLITFVVRFPAVPSAVLIS